MNCVRCGKAGAIARERLSPRNLRAVRLRLCTPCGRELGFRPVDFGRGSYANPHALGASVHLVNRFR